MFLMVCLYFQSESPGDMGSRSTWEYLPDLLLERVYAMLSIRQRYYCSIVCKPWSDVFYYPAVWRHLQVGENTFTYRRFNLYKGYQKELSHNRVQMCLARVGQHIRSLTILPLHDFYNLYAFLNVLSSYLEYFEDDTAMPNLHFFSYTFACESEGYTDTTILGTGGKLLEELKRLLGNMKHLRELTLNQLLLDNKDAHGLLDNVVHNCGNTLTRLEILNSTKSRYPLFYVGMFSKLRKLVISPLQLTDDVVIMLAKNTSLKDLVIVQDKYSYEADPVSLRAWWEVKQLAPKLRVKLEIRGSCLNELLIQENAPVKAVVYDSPYSTIDPHTVLKLSHEYRNSLQVYGHLGLPRKHGSRSFSDRADTSLVMLIRQCPRIHTLVVRERVSTATLLVIASEAKCLENFYVRRNAVLKRRDWPKCPEWTDDFYVRLMENSLSYEAVEREVSQKLGVQWRMMSDSAFKRISRDP